MEKIKDLLEKAIFHKYIRKEPDGKGGFRYVYEEKEIESRSKIINKKQDVIEMTNVNPKQIAKSFKKWLENEGIRYEYIESKSTASSYFKFKKKNSDFDIRISNHTKKNQDKETDLGIDFNLYGDGSSDISINTAYGYKTEDLKKIISDVERLSSKKNYETIIKESNNFELLDLPKREGILKVLEQIGIEESEYALLYSFVEKWMDFNRTKSEYKSYLENKRQEKAQKNKEVQKQSFTIGDVTVYPQKDKKSFDWEYVYNKEKPQGTAEEVKKWKEDRKEAMKYAKLNSWKIYNQTITKSMEIIEKAKKGSPIGTEKTWGGKLYIKTERGWRPKAKGREKVNEEESSKNQSSTEILVKQAASATNEQLKAAIKDPEANSKLKKVAQQELSKRNKQQDSDDESNKQYTIEAAYKRLLEAQEKGELELDQSVLDKIQEKLQESRKKKESEEESIDNKLDKLKQEITGEIDKKLSDMTGFKKITQTYVKQDGKTVVIKMKGDNQYKATSPGFKLESKPYESLVDFKKRIKEELNQQSEKTDQQSEKTDHLDDLLKNAPLFVDKSVIYKKQREESEKRKIPLEEIKIGEKFIDNFSLNKKYLKEFKGFDEKGRRILEDAEGNLSYTKSSKTRVLREKDVNELQYLADEENLLKKLKERIKERNEKLLKESLKRPPIEELKNLFLCQ